MAVSRKLFTYSLSLMSWMYIESIHEKSIITDFPYCNKPYDFTCFILSSRKVDIGVLRLGFEIFRMMPNNSHFFYRSLGEKASIRV